MPRTSSSRDGCALKAPRWSVDPTKPSSLEHDGAVLQVPPKSFVDDSGKSIQKPVDVSFTYIAPDEHMRDVGGMGIDGSPDQILLSFGMVSVQIEADGKPVELAPGGDLACLHTRECRRVDEHLATSALASESNVWRLGAVDGQQLGTPRLDLGHGD